MELSPNHADYESPTGREPMVPSLARFRGMRQLREHALLEAHNDPESLLAQMDAEPSPDREYDPTELHPDEQTGGVEGVLNFLSFQHSDNGTTPEEKLALYTPGRLKGDLQEAKMELSFLGQGNSLSDARLYEEIEAPRERHGLRKRGGARGGHRVGGRSKTLTPALFHVGGGASEGVLGSAHKTNTIMTAPHADRSRTSSREAAVG